MHYPVGVEPPDGEARYVERRVDGGYLVGGVLVMTAYVLTGFATVGLASGPAFVA